MKKEGKTIVNTKDLSYRAELRLNNKKVIAF
jgi:hypothetical protein